MKDIHHFLCEECGIYWYQDLAEEKNTDCPMCANDTKVYDLVVDLGLTAFIWGTA